MGEVYRHALEGIAEHVCDKELRELRAEISRLAAEVAHLWEFHVPAEIEATGPYQRPAHPDGEEGT